MSSTDTRKKKHDDKGKITKGKLFNKLSSLFKSNKNPKKRSPPAIENKNLKQPEDSRINEENNLMESSSDEQCSEMKIRNVTIELETNGYFFDGDKNNEIFAEEAVNQSNINSSHLAELAKMPLFILDSNNKLIINPEIKIRINKPKTTETKMISKQEKSRERNNVEKFKFKKNTSCSCHEKKFQDGILSIIIKSPVTQSNAQKSTKCKNRGTSAQESLPFLQDLVNADIRKHSTYKNNKQKVVFLLNPRSQLTSNESVDCTSTSASKSAVTTLFSSIDYPDSYCSSYSVNTSEDSRSIDKRKLDIKTLLTSESTQEKFSLDSMTSCAESNFFDEKYCYHQTYCVNNIQYDCFPEVTEKKESNYANHAVVNHKNPLYLEESQKFKTELRNEIAYLLPLTSLPPNDIKRTLKLLKNAGERFSQMVNDNGEKKRKQRKRRPENTPCRSSSSSSLEEAQVIKNTAPFKRQQGNHRKKMFELRNRHSEKKRVENRKCAGTKPTNEKKQIDTTKSEKKNINSAASEKKPATTKTVEKKSTPIRSVVKKGSNRKYVEKELQIDMSISEVPENHFLGIDLKINKYQNPAIVFCNIPYPGENETIENNIITSKCVPKKHQNRRKLDIMQKHKGIKMEDDTKELVSKEIVLSMLPIAKVNRTDQRQAILKIKESLNNWIRESICYGTRTLLKNKCLLSTFSKSHCVFFESVSVI